VLDQTSASSVAEGRQYFQKYNAAARIFPAQWSGAQTGDRFFNRDYAATLRTIASEGASLSIVARLRVASPPTCMPTTA
jgi:gamma-glutamyltranspeptidase